MVALYYLFGKGTLSVFFRGASRLVKYVGRSRTRRTSGFDLRLLDLPLKFWYTWCFDYVDDVEDAHNKIDSRTRWYSGYVQIFDMSPQSQSLHIMSSSIVSYTCMSYVIMLIRTHCRLKCTYMLSISNDSSLYVYIHVYLHVYKYMYDYLQVYNQYSMCIPFIWYVYIYIFIFAQYVFVTGWHWGARLRLVTLGIPWSLLQRCVLKTVKWLSHQSLWATSFAIKGRIQLDSSLLMDNFKWFTPKKIRYRLNWSFYIIDDSLTKHEHTNVHFVKSELCCLKGKYLEKDGLSLGLLFSFLVRGEWLVLWCYIGCCSHSLSTALPR